jgi:two-component system, LytTR family, response regulator
MKLKTIIVEDEHIWQRALINILTQHCKDTVEIVDVTSAIEQSVDSIKKHKPQLIFLDIKLGDHDEGAFQILKSLDSLDFKIVFTTIYDTPSKILTALNQFGAVKYLVKPLKSEDVEDAVNFALSGIKSEKNNNDSEILKKMLAGYIINEPPARLQIPHKNGFQYVPYSAIIMLRSDGNSTLIFTTDNKTINSSKNLKYFESALPEKIFSKVSRSYLINIGHVQGFSNEDGGTIFLTGDCYAPLSKNLRDAFFTALNG